MKTYSTNYLAEAFEIDRASATRALRDVAPDQEQTAGRPTYKIATFHRALEIHHLKNASNNDRGADGASDTASLTQARVRIALANAESKERANLVAGGELVPAQRIIDMLGPVFSVMREISLSLPGKVSDALANYALEAINKALAAGRGTAESLTNLRSVAFGILNHEVRENLTNLSSPESYINAFNEFRKSGASPASVTSGIASDKLVVDHGFSEAEANVTADKVTADD